jgi:peptide/nickel transport system ATP-binding protein
VRAIAHDCAVMQQGRGRTGSGAGNTPCAARRYTRTLLASVPEMDPDWLNKRLSVGAAR